jgi:hypothetical protein
MIDDKTLDAWKRLATEGSTTESYAVDPSDYPSDPTVSGSAVAELQRALLDAVAEIERLYADGSA